MQALERDVFDVLMNMGVSLVLSVLVSFMYRFTHAGYSYSRHFNVSLVSISLIITMTMMVIANRVSLSLGLVGAISVIRFRTAVKDPRDLSYIFLAISVGLAAATSDYVIATAGTLTVCTVMLLLHYIQFGHTQAMDYTLTFCLESPENTKDFQDAAKDMFSKITLRSSAQIDDRTYEYVYIVYPRRGLPDNAMGVFRDKVPGISRMSLIRPETFIEI